MAPPTTAADPKPNAIVPIQPNRAYVTFLPRGGDDVEGVVGLVKGLRNVKSKYRLVVAVLLDFPEEDRKKLEDQGCDVQKIELLQPPKNQTKFAMGYNVINYSKLRIWKFVEYSKMIYVDGNIQVYDNIDHLFDKQDGLFHAVMDCFCGNTWSPPQYKNRCCQQRPDLWPEAELGPRPAPYFNAGMFVFEPSLLTYHGLLEKLKDTPPTPFAEQEFLNMYFQSIYSPIDRPLYNLVLPMLWTHPEKIGLNNFSAAGLQPWMRMGKVENMERLMEKWFDKVKVVQYCAAGSKPWKYTGKEENMDREDVKILVMKWWDIYNNVSLDYWNCEAPVAKAEPVNLQPLLVALSDAGVGDYNPGPSAA